MAFTREQEIKYVCGDNAHNIFLEPRGFFVGRSEKLWVLDHDTLIKISFMSPDKNVNNIQKVTRVVKNDPTKREDVLKFPEARSPDYEDQVIHNSKVDYYQPFVIIILARIKCKISPDSSIQIGWSFVVT